MSAEIEEVVLHAHLVELEQLLPDLGDHALHLVAGSHVRRLPREADAGQPCPSSKAGSEDTISESSGSECRARLERTFTRPSSTVSRESTPNMVAWPSSLRVISSRGVTVRVKG
jgi:hypothetical protein